MVAPVLAVAAVKGGGAAGAKGGLSGFMKFKPGQISEFSSIFGEQQSPQQPQASEGKPLMFSPKPGPTSLSKLLAALIPPRPQQGDSNDQAKKSKKSKMAP